MFLSLLALIIFNGFQVHFEKLVIFIKLKHINNGPSYGISVYTIIFFEVTIHQKKIILHREKEHCAIFICAHLI